MCSAVELGNKAATVYVKDHMRWLLLEPGQQIENLPGVQECPHNISMVSTKPNGSSTSVRVCKGCMPAASRPSPNLNWLTNITTPTRLWLLRQPHEALASMSFLTPVLTFGTLSRDFYYARGEGTVSATSLAAGYLGPLVKLVQCMSDATKASVAFMIQRMQSTSAYFKTYTTLFESNLPAHPLLDPVHLPAMAAAAARAPVPALNLHTSSTHVSATAISNNIHLSIRPAAPSTSSAVPNSLPVMGSILTTTCTQTNHLHLMSDDTHLPPLENASKPYLFPNDIGAWHPSHQTSLRTGTYTAYLAFRTNRQWLTHFTMDPAWLLEAYQLKLKLELHSAPVSCQVSSAAQDDFNLSSADCHRMRHTLPQNITGSPRYFLNHLNQAKAACQYLGKTPDFFLTITCNEFYWPEMRDLTSLVQSLLQLPGENPIRNAFTRAPCEVGRLFCLRLHWFVTNFLDTTPGHQNAVFGEVLYHLTKIEFQCRGSCHAHIAITLRHQSDVDRVDSEIIATLPDIRRYPHLDTPFWRRVYTLVNACQIHKCSLSTCQLHGGTCSRLFPRPPCAATYLDPALERYEYMRLSAADSMIVNYHPGLLYILGCSCHLQHGTQTGWINYLLKYQLKVDTQGYVPVNASTLHAFGLPASVSCGTLQACAASLHSKVVSVNEAAWVLQNNDLVWTCPNINYVRINLDAPQRRHFAFGGSSTASHITDMYFDRPAAMHHLTIVQFKSEYVLKPSTKCLDELQHDPLFVTAIDNKPGKYFFVNPVPTAPLLRAFGPRDGDSFYYSELFQRFPFSSNDEAFCSQYNFTKSWLEAAYLYNVFTSDADLVKFVSEAAKYDWEGDVRDHNLDFIASETPVQNMLVTRDILMERAMLDLDTVLPDHTSSPADLSAFFMRCIGREYVPTLSPTTLNPRCMQCMSDPYQAHAITSILDTGAVNKLWRIQGPAGHGKTHVLQTIICLAAARGLRVILCATTAKAAQLLGMTACTAHHAFGFQGDHFIPLTDQALLMYIRMADLIAIDEISMARADFLQQIHQRTLDAAPTGETRPFANKIVILSGDKHQLPAVCTRHCAEATCIHQPYRWPMWSAFTELNLLTNHRQDPSNAIWISALNTLRVSPPTPSILALLQSRVLPIGVHPPMLPNIWFIAGTNEEVDSYNLARSQQLYGSTLVNVDAEDSLRHSPRFTQSDAAFLRKQMADHGVLRQHLSVAPGMTLMLTKNMTHPPVHNGMLATVIAATSTSLSLHVHGNNLPVTLSRVISHKYKCGARLTRKGFPAVPAFARTVHKVQGDTISDCVFIDFTNMARLGQAYVALSRVVHLDKLFILPPGLKLTAAMFNPHVPTA
jgi:hypothetical protein